MSPIFSRHPRGELSAYVDAQVTDSRRQAIETHIASCDSCRLEVDDLREVRSALAALPQAEAPRSFAITAEMVASPAAALVERTTPSFASGLRMASAAIGVALIAVVLVDAGNFSATDDGGDTGVARENQVETQADGDFLATEGSDSTAGGAGDAAEPASEPSVVEDAGNVAGGASSGAAPDTGEGTTEGGGDSADADTPVETVPEEPVADDAESAARSAETDREPYGLFPGVPPPPNYIYSAPKPANGGIGGFGPASGMSNGGGESENAATGDEAEAAPEATAAEAPTAEAAPVPEATAADEALTEGAEEYAVDDADDAAAPDAAGGSEAQALGDDSGGLSTLNIVEIVLAVGLALAIIGGFVLPRLPRTAG
jgi:Putative zinc-finger